MRREGWRHGPDHGSPVGAAPSGTLNGAATVSEPQAVALHALSNFTVGSNALTILDGAGNQ